MDPIDSTQVGSWARTLARPPEARPAGVAAHPWEVTPHPLSGQRCMKSTAAFAAGETLAAFGAAAIVDRPSRMTVQVSEHTHILLAPSSLSFMNHGCSPNVHLDVDRRVLVALRPIAPGDELEFFYPSTEWTMASPFACHCRSARCLGRIGGASQVPDGLLRGRPLAPHVARLLAEAGRPVVAA